MKKKRKLFCEYGPICYQTSLRKEWILRSVRDILGNFRFAGKHQSEPLPHLVQSHRSLLLRNLEGVDMALQHNKVTNLWLASAPIHGMLIHPGETFSFWHTVGNCTAAKGYLPGLAISNGKTTQTVGGGLCQLANLIHWMVLQSPLTVTELHHHTDALFPDNGRKVPFGTGTSVLYNHVDYRFRNDTGSTFQLLIWLEEQDLCGELCCGDALPYRYRIQERDHHYCYEDGEYYRNSEIWKRKIDRASGETVEEFLVFRNHSKVMYDPAFIPLEEIRGPHPLQKESSIL